MQLPTRLAAGKMFIGPDHYGCMNTGLAPTLLHSKFLHDHPSAGRGYRFAIGPEVFVQEAVRKLVLGKVPPGQAYAEFNDGRDRVTFAKTYATAKRRFGFLVDEITKANAKVRATHLRLRRRAAKGDMKAVMSLMDY